MSAPQIVCPLVTPLTIDGHLDREVLETLVDAVAAEVDVLMLLGTTGELATVAPSVADELVSVVSELTELPLVVGVGACGGDEVRRNLARVPAGATVSICPPYYFQPTPLELIDHVSSVADGDDHPVLLYNIPQHTHQVIGVDVVAALHDHPRVIGIKDSGPDRGHFESLLAFSGPDFVVLRGTDERGVHDYLDQGADGFVAGLENILPGLMRHLIDRGRSDAAGLSVLEDLLTLVEGNGGLRAIKFLVSRIHGGSGMPAAPLTRPAAQDRSALADGLAQLQDRWRDAQPVASVGGRTR